MPPGASDAGHHLDVVGNGEYPRNMRGDLCGRITALDPLLTARQVGNPTFYGHNHRMGVEEGRIRRVTPHWYLSFSCISQPPSAAPSPGPAKKYPTTRRHQQIRGAAKIRLRPGHHDNAVALASADDGPGNGLDTRARRQDGNAAGLDRYQGQVYNCSGPYNSCLRMDFSSRRRFAVVLG